MTGAADTMFEQLKGKLSDMVTAAALTEAHRRSATQIDSPDFQADYDRVVNPSKRRRAVEIIADFTVAFGSALIGYAGSIYYAGPTDRSAGRIAPISGTCLLAFGIFLKYSPATR